MKFEEFNDAVRKGLPLTTARCIACGKEAVYYFGFASPCRFNGGSHPDHEEVETTLDHERVKVQACYSTCLGFERKLFDKHVPRDIRKILLAR
jgi:hypothetical protein